MLLHLASVCVMPRAHAAAKQACGCSYTGTDGIYTYTVAYDRDPACLSCSAGLPVDVGPSDTLQQVDSLSCCPR